MAPLYKRYIPPPTSQAAPVQVTLKEKAVNPQTVPKDDRKRKRERTEEEVAQRKAKKLQKKGVDTPVPPKGPSPDVVNGSTNGAEREPTSKPQDGNDEPKSEFAHIKNVKKRHKLEKEARKARKLAEKGTDNDNAFGTNETAADVDALKSRARVVQLSIGDSPEIDQAVPHVPEDTGVSAVVTDGNSVDGVNAEVANSPRPKKRRHKLEAVLQEPVTGEDDSTHLQKHSSILEKFRSSTRDQTSPDEPDGQASEADNPTIVHDLIPFPQPEAKIVEAEIPEYSDLPSWLRRPITAPEQTNRTFQSMGLESKLVERLGHLNFQEALPVQQTLIPLLLPPGMPGATYPRGCETIVPDLAVSAPTGSGKTLAYLLPIVESLRLGRRIGKLKALIVVPTRELVMQVSAIADSLMKGSGITIGMATGSGKLRDEQERIVTRSLRFDPAEYQKLTRKEHSRNFPALDDGGEEEVMPSVDTLDTLNDNNEIEIAEDLVDHVPVYGSAVDLLVCTPGRLIDHLKNTRGFTVAHLEWLILDEADKLMEQQYDGFLDLLVQNLGRQRNPDEQDSREIYLRSTNAWDDREERRTRKVLLSATMTRDISKLVSLGLRRPQLVLAHGVSSEGQEQLPGAADVDMSLEGRPGETYELPASLLEYCIPVGDGSEKPLFLVNLLDSTVIGGAHAAIPSPQADSGSDTDTSSDTDSLSESSSDEESDASSVSSSEDSTMEDTTEQKASDSIHPARAALLATSQAKLENPTVLIFAASNEAASRLSHLLKLLKPEWSSWITTLTKSRQTIRNLPAGSLPSLTVSTDRAARGLDKIGARPITHVIQYDVPRSVQSYVHRVGRTARAGRQGEAHTLYSHSEARWFLHEITRAQNILRKSAVEKVKLAISDESLKKSFARALEQMREEVAGDTK